MSELYAKIDFRELELGTQKELLKACVASDYVEDQEVVESDEEAATSGLNVGDIVFNDTVCIERKEPSDFIESMKSGHLEDQLQRMYEEYNNVHVLVSGTMEEVLSPSYSNINRNAVRAFIASLSVRWQTPPLFCGDETTLAFTAIDMARKSFEPLKRHPGQPDIDVEDELNSVGKVVMTVDGIGRETAKDVGEEFWTVQDVCQASLSDLQEIDGIGPKTASKISSQLQ
jgi:Fanconi anemia group M protein